MKLVIQRAASASVEVDGAVVGRIERGLVLLLGIEQGDTLEQVSQLATKVLKIRLWPDVKDPSKQWCSSVVDNGFGLLVVSQFTLFATFKKPKPDFHQAMGGDQAKELYEAFVSQCRTACGADKVATGVFGAMMQVDLRNDGPVTVELVAGPPALAPAPTAGAAAPSPAGGGAADAAWRSSWGGSPTWAASCPPRGTRSCWRASAPHRRQPLRRRTWRAGSSTCPRSRRRRGRAGPEPEPAPPPRERPGARAHAARAARRAPLPA
ncbi:unnamed protein product [Prorocentrum cordatum]|uniref:D-aminoacyl-tRNA deacylase n=1 Tax=Prorocentrum cordatum TaxID=2364126 RepID=A0ABN9R2Z3_9DINO|nr:unnamed protein product [Polarella glacialis]